MAFEHYIRNGTKNLRLGYTTGTCAALAAAGACEYLLSGKAPQKMSVMTGKGLLVEVEPDDCGLLTSGEAYSDCALQDYPEPAEQFKRGTEPVPDEVRSQLACRDGDRQDPQRAWCAVKKDGGDDIDATHGMLIVATVKKSEVAGISIDGGKGIGRVTKPGLDQPVGNAAINRVPRQMIVEAVTSICDEFGYEGGIEVVISAPEGETIAKKTFNPVLGVEGGISILGTSGIVEPMSEQALVETIAIHMHQAALKSKDVILIPGNYGEDFIKEHMQVPAEVPQVKISNFLGEALDLAVVEKFEHVLLVSHIGKIVKVAGGIMNTHSKWADCRMELFAAHAAYCGADHETVRKIMEAATTDAAIHLLQEAGMQEIVMKSLMDAIKVHLDRRVQGALEIEAVAFSNEYGFLGRTEN